MPDILTRKQYRDFNKVCRYAGIPYYYNTRDERFMVGMATNLREDTPHRLHKVTDEDTLDSLALYYYNNPTYFWIIADYNRIQDPYAKLPIGSKLKIPTFAAIEFEE